MEEKKRKKLRAVIVVLTAVAAIVIIYALAVNGAIMNAVSGKIKQTEEVSEFGADCILVLGAGIRKDGTPSDMLADRLKVAIDLYESGAAPCLLLSGDHSRPDYDEVGAMMEYVRQAGVPEEAIVPDYAGFSTYESVYRARDIFSAERVIIVTQEYHLYRALYIAEALGGEAVGVSSDLRSYRGQFMREAREILARNKDFIYTILKPEPTYLGDKIPLYSDGSGETENTDTARILTSGAVR